MQQLDWLPVAREAGEKSFSNAIAEVREAVDFLHYYAGQVTISITKRIAQWVRGRCGLHHQSAVELPRWPFSRIKSLRRAGGRQISALAKPAGADITLPPGGIAILLKRRTPGRRNRC